MVLVCFAFVSCHANTCNLVVIPVYILVQENWNKKQRVLSFVDRLYFIS